MLSQINYLFSPAGAGKDLVDDLNKNVTSKSSNNEGGGGGGSSNTLTQLETNNTLTQHSNAHNTHTHHQHHHHPPTLANLDTHQNNGPPSHRQLEVIITG